MADLLIKDVDMPLQCYDCLLIAEDPDTKALYCKTLNKDVYDLCKRMSDCPLVEVQQSEDVKPIRHGHWLKNGSRYCECSVCHHEGNTSGSDNYCWFCGSKMDIQ